MQTKNANEWVEEGRRVLRVEAEALLSSARELGESFGQAVEILHESLAAGGKIVVSGVGKSGNVAQKVAATLTSTGSLAVFRLHPTEALHGDLGLLAPNDVLLVFSHSGSSQEILLMLPSAQELCRGAVAVLGNPDGPIARFAKAVISSRVSSEACPDNLAPTASSTLAMAIGDCVALALKKKAGFGPEKFARLHPGGQLGRLLARVEDLMHGEGDFGMLPPSASMDEVVIALTKFRHSGICIVEGKTPGGRAKLVGVIVEGDIRRALLRKEAFFALKASEIMTAKPKSVHPRTRAAEALELMENRSGQLSFLPVVDDDGGCAGVLRVHDLVLSGLN